MAATPTSGEKVVRLRIPLIPPSLRPGVEGEREQAGDAEQHHERIVVDVAALEAADPDAEPVGKPGDSVRPEPVDDLLVAALPEQVAERLGATDEDKVVELVEEPLVVDEEVERPATGGEARGQALVQQVHVGGDQEAG